MYFVPDTMFVKFSYDIFGFLKFAAKKNLLLLNLKKMFYWKWKYVFKWMSQIVYVLLYDFKKFFKKWKKNVNFVFSLYKPLKSDINPE